MSPAKLPNVGDDSLQDMGNLRLDTNITGIPRQSAAAGGAAALTAAAAPHSIGIDTNKSMSMFHQSSRDPLLPKFVMRSFLEDHIQVNEAIPVTVNSTVHGDASGRQRTLKIFCYALVIDPSLHQEDLLLSWAKRDFARACDGWALYSTGTDPSKGIIKAYPQTRPNEEFFTREDTFLGVWRNHIKDKIGDFDFFVKLDSDTVVRPSVFRQMFLQHDFAQPVILSVTECHPEHQRHHGGDHPCVDGYFVAVSREAAQRILSLRKPETCRLAAFGDFIGDSDDEGMLQHCVEATGIRFEEPFDTEHYHMIPFERQGCKDVMPIEFEDAKVLASGKPLCGKYAFQISVDMKGRPVSTQEAPRCCYSPHMALFHQVKTQEDISMIRQVFSADFM